MCLLLIGVFFFIFTNFYMLFRYVRPSIYGLHTQLREIVDFKVTIFVSRYIEYPYLYVYPQVPTKIVLLNIFPVLVFKVTLNLLDQQDHTQNDNIFKMGIGLALHFDNIFCGFGFQNFLRHGVNGHPPAEKSCLPTKDTCGIK